MLDMPMGLTKQRCRWHPVSERLYASLTDTLKVCVFVFVSQTFDYANDMAK